MSIKCIIFNSFSCAICVIQTLALLVSCPLKPLSPHWFLSQWAVTRNLCSFSARARFFLSTSFKPWSSSSLRDTLVSLSTGFLLLLWRVVSIWFYALCNIFLNIFFFLSEFFFQSLFFSTFLFGHDSRHRLICEPGVRSLYIISAQRSSFYS